MTSLSVFPGLPGLFVAGIFSACLSSVSSAINSLAAATVEDFLHPICLRNVSEKWTTIFTKLTAFSYGIICIFLTFVIDKAEGLLQTFGLILFNVVGGPMLGLFTLGMLFRRPTSEGAMTGYLLSLGLSSFIALRGVMNGGQKKPSSHLSTAECPSNVSISLEGYLNSTYDDPTVSGNWTIPLSTLASQHVTEYAFPLLKISYMWYAGFGFLVCFVIGYCTSLFWGKKEYVSPQLLSPITKLWITEKYQAPEVCISFAKDIVHVVRWIWISGLLCNRLLHKFILGNTVEPPFKGHRPKQAVNWNIDIPFSEGKKEYVSPQLLSPITKLWITEKYQAPEVVQMDECTEKVQDGMSICCRSGI
ncbi:putative sodium-dependent multivitamin transporter [Nephila pilipes]|uniref:Putative sodium-dependent multivitamin transporter n=1 Tax=Nephila pilipes TaxID=299642 RepID=A0A8X6QLA6_NEPPI|nr:putative sodium-dependent multivitamin transporter [Nephila pilipes]